MNEIEKLPSWTEPQDLSSAKAAIISLGRSMHEHAFLIGKTLLWIKGQIGHGHLGTWLTANVWFGHRTAQRFMKFADKCERERGLLSYSPGSKNDIMTDLNEPSGAGVSGLAVRLVRRTEHGRIRKLLEHMDRLQDELHELTRSGLPSDDTSDGYPQRFAAYIHGLNRLIGDEDEKIDGAIPVAAGEILREYGRFLMSLDKDARGAFEEFESVVIGALDRDGDGSTVVREWFQNAPDIDRKRFELGTELSLCCVGIMRQFASTKVQAEGV